MFRSGFGSYSALLARDLYTDNQQCATYSTPCRHGSGFTRICIVLIFAFSSALLLTGAVSARTVKVVIVDSAPQVRTFLGATTVKFVGINPIRWSVQLPAANTTVTNAPAPAFLPSVGTATVTGATVTTAPGGTRGPPPEPICSNLANGIANASVYIGALAQFAETYIQIHPGLSNPETADAENAAFITAINGSADKPNLLFNNARACLTNLQNALATATTPPTADQKTAVAALAAAYSSLLTNGVALSDVEPQQTISCKGLLGGSSVSTLTLTLTPRTAPPGGTSSTQVTTITVKCLGNVAVSAGFVFSSLSQATYTALPANTGSSTPASTATIQQQSTSSVHPIPYAFAHVALPGISNCNAEETCTFFTFGAGVTSSTNSSANNIDFAAGITESFSRYLYVTGGVNLGQQTIPASGYNVGTPIAVGATVPTVTTQRLGLFVGFSFGARP